MFWGRVDKMKKMKWMEEDGEDENRAGCVLLSNAVGIALSVTSHDGE